MDGTRDRIAEVERLVAPVLDGMGFELVRVRSSGGRRPTLQIMAEPADRGAMTVDDCAAISRNVSAVLDVDDPFAGAYTLEVSSPGLDRPLVRKEDYRRFAGRRARIETHRPIDGRRRFTGCLAGLRGETIAIDCGGVQADIPLGDVARAKLLPTDEPAAAHGNG